MTVGNFNWFLHSMLFCHTNIVLERQARKRKEQDTESGEDDDSEEEEE